MATRLTGEAAVAGHVSRDARDQGQDDQPSARRESGKSTVSCPSRRPRSNPPNRCSSSVRRSRVTDG